MYFSVMYVCIGVCVYVYIYIYVCVCVCVCMYVLMNLKTFEAGVQFLTAVLIKDFHERLVAMPNGK
jgi:hypothetical protein